MPRPPAPHYPLHTFQAFAPAQAHGPVRVPAAATKVEIKLLNGRLAGPSNQQKELLQQIEARSRVGTGKRIRKDAVRGKAVDGRRDARMG